MASSSESIILKQDLLNASRFITTTRKTLSSCGDDIDTDKLHQLIAVLTFTSESLASSAQLCPKSASLQLQLEELRKDLLSRPHSANEMKKINLQTLHKENEPVFTGDLSVLSSAIILSESEHGQSRGGDAVSGERIHSLLQQQKVRYFIDDHLARSTLTIEVELSISRLVIFHSVILYVYRSLEGQFYFIPYNIYF